MILDAQAQFSDSQALTATALSTNVIDLSADRAIGRGTPTAPAQNADLLVAGYTFVLPLPPTGLGESERYLGVRYTLAGTTPTITVSAYLVPMSMLQGNESFPDAITIS